MGLNMARRFLFGLSLILCPLWSSASALAQEAAGEQAAIPPGTKITIQNWQQYKQFMPDGMRPLTDRYPPDTRPRRRSTEIRPRSWSFPMAAMT